MLHRFPAGRGAAACDGSLSPQDVATLRESFRMDDHARAMYNAVTSIDISQLALNRDIVRKQQRPVQQQDQDQHGDEPVLSPAAAGSSPG